jgi:hypothetical protein
MSDNKYLMDLEQLTSRNIVNHFVIGYYALYVFYNDFSNLRIDVLLILSVVASYLLFLPARFISLIIYNDEGDKCPDHLIWKVYHFRIFAIFLIFTTIKLLNINDLIIQFVNENLFLISLIVFVFVLIADLITWYYVKTKFQESDCKSDNKRTS